MESDGIEEALEGHLRLLVTAAAQLGERIARAREKAQRQAQAASEQDAREFASRLDAEKKVARLELARVHQAQWWDSAQPDDIARTYRLATAWETEDPEAERAVVRVRDELRIRYGIDSENTGTAPDDVDKALRAWAGRDRELDPVLDPVIDPAHDADLTPSAEPSADQEQDGENGRDAAPGTARTAMGKDAGGPENEVAPNGPAGDVPDFERWRQWEWVDHATQDELARAYGISAVAAPDNEAAWWANARIEGAMHRRFNVIDIIDTQELGTAERIAAEADRLMNVRAREKSQQDVEAAELMMMADREEAAAGRERDAAQYEPAADDRVHAAAAAERHEANAERSRELSNGTYDTAQRREATADDLATQGLAPELVETRMVADVSQGRPATDAVKQTGKRTAPKARRGRTPGRTAQTERGSLGR